MFYLFQYYAESHGIIYVIDSTDEERLGESKNAFGEGSIQFCTITILISGVISVKGLPSYEMQACLIRLHYIIFIINYYKY